MFLGVRTQIPLFFLEPLHFTKRDKTLCTCKQLFLDLVREPNMLVHFYGVTSIQLCIATHGYRAMQIYIVYNSDALAHSMYFNCY